MTLTLICCFRNVILISAYCFFLLLFFCFVYSLIGAVTIRHEKGNSDAVKHVKTNPLQAVKNGEPSRVLHRQ